MQRLKQRIHRKVKDKTFPTQYQPIRQQPKSQPPSIALSVLITLFLRQFRPSHVRQGVREVDRQPRCARPAPSRHSPPATWPAIPGAPPPIKRYIRLPWSQIWVSWLWGLVRFVHYASAGNQRMRGRAAAYGGHRIRREGARELESCPPGASGTLPRELADFKGRDLETLGRWEYRHASANPLKLSVLPCWPDQGLGACVGQARVKPTVGPESIGWTNKWFGPHDFGSWHPSRRTEQLQGRAPVRPSRLRTRDGPFPDDMYRRSAG